MNCHNILGFVLIDLGYGSSEKIINMILSIIGGSVSNVVRE